MDYVYTLDKLVAVMRVKTKTINFLLNTLRNDMLEAREIPWFGRIKFERPGYGIRNYHENLVIVVDTGESFYFAVRPNTDAPSEYWETCKVEFNPAKVGCCLQFMEFYNQLIEGCKWVDFKRFDVAIDIPVPRENVMMFKDIRKYTSIEYSAANKTTYLGCRTQHGQVKLYNKQLESKLEFPLTRLEITLDYAKCTYSEFKRLFPRVVAMTSVENLKDTDLVLCMACLEHEEYLRMLGRKMRKKIETLLHEASQELVPDEILYKEILTQILWYGKGIPIQLHEFTELEDAPDNPFPEPRFREVIGEQEEL